MEGHIQLSIKLLNVKDLFEANYLLSSWRKWSEAKIGSSVHLAQVMAEVRVVSYGMGLDMAVPYYMAMYGKQLNSYGIWSFPKHFIQPVPQ